MKFSHYLTILYPELTIEVVASNFLKHFTLRVLKFYITLFIIFSSVVVLRLQKFYESYY